MVATHPARVPPQNLIQKMRPRPPARQAKDGREGGHEFKAYPAEDSICSRSRLAAGEELAQQVAEASEDAGAGFVDGPDGDLPRGSNFVGSCALDLELPEHLPGGGLEIALPALASPHG